MDIAYYITYDKAVPYRGLKIYPVNVENYLFFNVFSQCLTVDKNSLPSAKIISMTYLEYLFYATEENPDQTPYVIWLDRLLEMCLKEDKSFEKVEESIKRYGYDEKGKPFIRIGEENYNAKDFEEIKNIICQQNLIDLPDENISKEVRDSLEKAKEYKARLNNARPATMEDYLISISMVTGWTLEYIYSMSIRKFLHTITRMDNLIHYKIYLTASMSGMVEFKDKSFIKHWLTNLEETDKYKDVSIGLDEMKDKVSLESAKK